MGLDQYAYKISFSDNVEERTTIQTWRKHPNLQGWIENLWRERGGEGEFNCEDVELSEIDLLKLQDDVMKFLLPETTGFFYGESCDKENMTTDLQFIDDALKNIKNGYRVVYDSWW